MSVSKADREAYERGVRDSEGFLSSATGQLRELAKVSQSDSEFIAYHKGLSGQQLDEN